MVTKLIWTLPVPPSANALWQGGIRTWRDKRTGGFRQGWTQWRSPAYEGWLHECSLLIGRAERVPGPVRVAITVRGGKGFREGRDLDNCVKPVVDLVRHKRVISDDNVTVVVEVCARYVPPVGTGAVASCVVEVGPAEGCP